MKILQTSSRICGVMAKSREGKKGGSALFMHFLASFVARLTARPVRSGDLLFLMIFSSSIIHGRKQSSSPPSQNILDVLILLSAENSRTVQNDYCCLVGSYMHTSHRSLHIQVVVDLCMMYLRRPSPFPLSTSSVFFLSMWYQDASLAITSLEIHQQFYHTQPLFLKVETSEHFTLSDYPVPLLLPLFLLLPTTTLLIYRFLVTIY